MPSLCLLASDVVCMCQGILQFPIEITLPHEMLAPLYNSAPCTLLENCARWATVLFSGVLGLYTLKALYFDFFLVDVQQMLGKGASGPEGVSGVFDGALHCSRKLFRVMGSSASVYSSLHPFCSAPPPPPRVLLNNSASPGSDPPPPNQGNADRAHHKWRRAQKAIAYHRRSSQVGLGEGRPGRA